MTPAFLLSQLAFTVVAIGGITITYALFRRTLKKNMELVTENSQLTIDNARLRGQRAQDRIEYNELAERLWREVPPEKAFSYQFAEAVTVPLALEVYDFLEEVPAEDYRLEHTDHGAVLRTGGIEVSLMRFSTENRDLALQFKLRFGGAA